MGLRLSGEELEEIAKRLVKLWRFWIQFCVAFIVALLLGVPAVTVIAVHFATKRLSASMEEFNEQASNHLATAYQDVTNRIGTALGNYERKANDQMAAAYQDVINRIAKEFEEPRFKEIVVQVATTQASSLLREQINPEIEKFRAGTSNTLARFDNSLGIFQTESTNALAEVRSATEFALIVAMAQNDDAGAFNQLVQIASSGGSSFGASARDICGAIVVGVETDVVAKQATVGWKWDVYGIDPDKASLQRFEDYYASAETDSMGRFNAVKQIFNSSRFPELERFDFAATVMQKDNSLRVRELCCDLMDTKAKSNLNFTRADSFLVWLAKNRQSLTNNPPTTVTK